MMTEIVDDDILAVDVQLHLGPGMTLLGGGTRAVNLLQSRIGATVENLLRKCADE